MEYPISPEVTKLIHSTPKLDCPMTESAEYNREKKSKIKPIRTETHTILSERSIMTPDNLMLNIFNK